MTYHARACISGDHWPYMHGMLLSVWHVWRLAAVSRQAQGHVLCCISVSVQLAWRFFAETLPLHECSNILAWPHRACCH